MKQEQRNAAEWQAQLTKKEAEIASLNRQVEWLTQQLRLMQGQRFGASSEQTQVLSEQFSLFNEAEDAADPRAAEPDLEEITYKRRKQAGKREQDFSGLPVEQVIHELQPAERVCPECGGALPLYRQEQELARIGVPISRQTMANWIMAAHERWFAEFVQVLRQELLSNEILHADETTLTVLKEPGRKAQQRSHVWVYRTSGDTSCGVI